MTIIPKKKKAMETKTKRFQSRPRTFRSLTGLSKEKYNYLLEELLPLYEKSEEKRMNYLEAEPTRYQNNSNCPL